MELFSDLPLPAKFFIAFVIVLGLIGGVAYLVRRFGTGMARASGPRARQPRLAVIESAAVDARRRLVLIRRDNVEHLIMLGGPSDVVVEANILRAAQPQPLPAREAPLPRVAAEPAEPPRLPPEATGWPGEPSLRPQRAAPERSAPEEAPLQPQQPEPAAARVPAPDRLSGLAAEFARSVGRLEPAPARAPAPEPRRAAAQAPPLPPAAAQPPAVQPADDRQLAAMASRLEAALRRPTGTRDGQPGEPALKPFESPRPAEQAARKPAGDLSPAGEARGFVRPLSLDAPLGRKPNEVLRRATADAKAPARPGPGDAAPLASAAQDDKSAAPADAGEAPANETTAADANDVAVAAAATPEPPAADAADGKNVFDSLEQEMANLLGRPPARP